MCLTVFARVENFFPHTLQVMEHAILWFWKSDSLLNCFLQVEQVYRLKPVLSFVIVFDEAFSGVPLSRLNDLSRALENPTEERK